MNAVPGVAGYIMRWDERAGEGLIRLDDAAPFRFDRAALGDPQEGGVEPRLGARIRVLRFTPEGDAALVIAPLGSTGHPATPRRAPFRGTISAVAGRGDSARGLVDGLEFSGRACVGFTPEVGREVWVCEYVYVSESELRASLLYPTDAPPSDIASRAAVARREEEEARAAAEEAHRAEARKKIELAAKRARRKRRDEIDAAYGARFLRALDDPLLAAVLAAPEEDEPRRALAARLRDEGNVYGEFIEAQLAPDRDFAREDALYRELPKRWRPPERAFRNAYFTRGFLTTVKLDVDVASARELVEDARLGTIERIDVDRKTRTIASWNEAYRALVTAPAATALRVVDISAIDAIADAPSFRRGRLRAVAGFPIFDECAVERFTDAAFDWIEDVHVEVTDRAWPRLFDVIAGSPFFARRRRRLHVWNHGCSYVDRREQAAAAWSTLPLDGFGVWDVAFERTRGGTVARFGGWKGVSGLIFPGIQMIDVVARSVPDLVAIETHGVAPPDEDDRSKLATRLPNVPVRHVPRPGAEREEGSCDF